jgi:uncharacterized protein YfdQ (DUF2303 family)
MNLKANLSNEMESTKMLASLGAALAMPTTNPDLDGKAYAIIPDGYKVAELPVDVSPKRSKGTVRLKDVDSFIRYYQDHAAPQSRIYWAAEPAKFIAVFDEISDTPQWREFRADFTVPSSREWDTWLRSDKQPKTQLQFAEFLQDNLPDIIEPDGATLLEMALQFETAQNYEFTSHQRLQNGTHDLVWKSNNSSARVSLPEFIEIKIPVFENSEVVPLRARLRYRVKEAALTFFYELVRPHKVKEQAIRNIVQRIKTDASAILLFGTPE